MDWIRTVAGRSGAAANDQLGKYPIVGRSRVVAGGEVAGDGHDPPGDLRHWLANRRHAGADRGDWTVVVADDADLATGAFGCVLDSEGELVAGGDDTGQGWLPGEQ